MPVQLGSDRLLDSSRLRGRRVGLLCNPASVNQSFQHIADLIASHPDVRLAAMFGPQHGFHSDVQDDMIETPHHLDRARKIPVYSLYSETREPTSEMLKDVELLVIDLQDVGTRIYTYVYTMAHCLRAGRAHGIPVMVCDRPNPIGGMAVEGPTLMPGFESVVGQFPIPLRHGMTIGELAKLFNEHFGIGADLEVIGMEGWSRSAYFDDTGLPWVMPSPNMPTLDTATVFPGSVLFEGTNVSEGRGTTRPFELVGAPWIDGVQIANRLNCLKLSGVHARGVTFQPTFQKHAGVPCGGVQLHVTDRARFKPVVTGVALLQLCHAAVPGRFAWREPPYEYERVKPPFDIISGSDRLRQQIDAGVPVMEIARSWEPAVSEFCKIREEYLMY